MHVPSTVAREEACLRRFSCVSFENTSFATTGTLLVDLGRDCGERESSHDNNEFHLYVDLCCSPFEEDDDVNSYHDADREGLSSMEAGRVRTADQRVELMLPCSTERPEESDTFNCLNGFKNFDGKTDEDNMFSSTAKNCLDAGSRDKGLVFVRKPQKKKVPGSNMLVDSLEHNFVDVRRHDMSGLPSKVSMNQASYTSLQNLQGKELGKRACRFLSAKKDGSCSQLMPSKRRKLTNFAQEPSPGQATLSSGARKQGLVKVESQILLDRKEIGINASRLRTGSDYGIGASTAELISKAASHDDLSKEEEAIELEQCVSLLKKYGILRTPEYYLSQRLPGRVPHPGYIGDSLSAKSCKTCGMPEEANGTVICDECQEAFHLSCCVPRISLKYFEEEDSWYCSACKKQKKKTASKLATENSSSQGTMGCKWKAAQSGMLDRLGNISPVCNNYTSRVRLGPAHQADVPLWTGRVEDADPNTFSPDQPGMEVPLTWEEKRAEKDHIERKFQDNVRMLGWLPAKELPRGQLENWLQCHCVVKRGFEERDEKKLTDDVICGKWRRAPLNVEQQVSWECFDAIIWDPHHADCAVDQELPTEEIMKRVQLKAATVRDLQLEVIQNSQIL